MWELASSIRDVGVKEDALARPHPDDPTRLELAYGHRRRRANGGAGAFGGEGMTSVSPAAFVVMGHTHTPAMVSVAKGMATYVNVGSWHEAEPTNEGPGLHRAARTHLVIHPAPTGPTAEFLAWSADGPRKFVGAL